MNQPQHLKSLILAIVALILAGSSCAEEPDTTVGIEGDLILCDSCPDSMRLEMTACAEGIEEKALADSLVIAAELDQSIHELVACGALSASVATSLAKEFFATIAAEAGLLSPDGLEYHPDGYYVSRDNSLGRDMEMQLRFYRPDTSGQKELIEENLFDLNSYLVGSKATVDTDISIGSGGVSGSAILKIVYDSYGPLIDLLGFGSNPENPVVLNLVDIPDHRTGFGDLEMEVTVQLRDERNETTIDYFVQSPTHLLRNVANNGNIGWDMKELRGDRAKNNQSFIATEDDWNLSFLGIGKLEGLLSTDVTGGVVNYRADLHYAESSFANTTVRCLNTEVN